MKTTLATTTAATALFAILLGFGAPTPFAVSAQRQQKQQHKACLPGTKKVCKCIIAARPIKAPTAIIKIPTKKPTKKPSKRPTRFPTATPTTTSPSGSPTTHPTAECANLRFPVSSYGGHRYAYVAHGAFAWDQAKAAASSLTCCGAPGHLLVVGDAAERDFVQATFNVAGQFGWIGLTDAVREGTYVWTDGTTLATSLFTPVPFDGNADEDDCGFFYNNPDDPSKWYTYSCANILFFSFVEFDC
jgi:Lectin C-type domain